MPKLQEVFDCNYDDFEDEDLSEENNQELIFFATSFVGDCKFLIKNYIECFFNDKNFYHGGKIPKNILLSDKNIYVVANYDIIRSVKKAYLSLESHPISNESLGEVTGDIRMVSSILNELAKSNIPQQFAGGMMLLYLELVLGIEIG